MIDGVTILNEVWVKTTAVSYLGGIIASVGLVLLFFTIIIVSNTEIITSMKLCVALLVASTSLIVAGVVIDITTVPKEIHYEVLISDDVSLTEFLDKYEIIDKRGEIYVVKPIEETEE